MRDFYGRVPNKNQATDQTKDSALIIALILLLKNECSDPMLIFALLYILT